MNNLMLALALNVALLVVNVFAFIHLIRETYKRNVEVGNLRIKKCAFSNSEKYLHTKHDEWQPNDYAICGGCGVSAAVDETGAFRYHKCLVPVDPNQSDLFSGAGKKVIAQGE